MSEQVDFLDWVEKELFAERAIAARAYDRADALQRLYSRTLEVASRVRRIVTVDDVFKDARNERDRAELRSLAARISGVGGDPADGNDALADEVQL